MTRTELEQRFADFAVPPTTRPEMDPITLAILMAALSAVISWSVERCLNRIVPEQGIRLGLIGRTRLKLWAHEAVQNAADAKGVKLDQAMRTDLALRVQQGALSTCGSLTAVELYELKRTLL